MKDYFYFTIHYKDTDEIRFMGDLAEHWWERWEEAVEFSSREPDMPDKSQWKICGDHLTANSIFGSMITIQLRNNEYEQHFIKSLRG